MATSTASQQHAAAQLQYIDESSTDKRALLLISLFPTMAFPGRHERLTHLTLWAIMQRTCVCVPIVKHIVKSQHLQTTPHKKRPDDALDEVSGIMLHQRSCLYAGVDLQRVS